MSRRSLRARYRRIVRFFVRVVAGLVWWELVLPWLRFRRLSRQTRPDRLRRIAVAFRELAIAMGGVMIKVGQFLSSRLDMLPREITSELAGLQDAVPAEEFADIRQVLETELGAPIAAHFLAFEETPMAAASLGQVHRARLAPDPSVQDPLVTVIVKVQRPHIEELIAVDLAALQVVARWLQRYRPIGRRADVPALLGEFSRTLYEEIDYLAEGRNAETFAANFRGRAGVRIPRVAWPTTTRRVLTLEDVAAIKVTDYDAITAAGVDRAAVARRLLDTYLQQIFEDGFFHADPHPGNLFVEPGQEGNWHLTFVDFGMVGRIAPNVEDGLREALIALGTRSAARLVKSYQMLGMLLPYADLELIERAEGRMFEHVWGKSMAELRQITPAEMHDVAREFAELFYDMPFQIPQDLIMLGRTIAILSGMCTGLDPDFNLWESLTPYAQKMLGGSEPGRAGALWEEVKRLGSSLFALPVRFTAVLDRIERGEVAVRMPQLTDHLARIERTGRRLIGAIIFAALCLGGAQFYAYGQETLGLLMLIGAGLALAWAIFAR